MECTGRNRIGSTNAIRVRKYRIELGFSQVPVPHPVQTALSNARISRFAGDQITEDMALCHPEKGEVVLEDFEDICRKVTLLNHAPPGDVARVLRLKIRFASHAALEMRGDGEAILSHTVELISQVIVLSREAPLKP